MNTYTFHITPYGLAFLGTIFIGLTFAALLLFTKSINQATKQVFGLGVDGDGAVDDPYAGY